jgi:hypothetical protein
MKKLLLLTLTALASNFVIGQLKLVYPGDLSTNINGTTVEVIDVASSLDMKYEAWVINLGSSAVSLKCRRTEIDVLTGTTNATCWGICPPYENAGDKPIYIASIPGVGQLIETIVANDTNKTFVGHYTPENLSGCSLILYEWFDGADPSTTLASLYVRFIHNGSSLCTASINEETETVSTKVFPVPANDHLTIQIDNNYLMNSPLSYEIINLLGEVVTTAQFNSTSNTQQISLSELKEGVYFIRIKNNGATLNTKKFTVVK